MQRHFTPDAARSFFRKSYHGCGMGEEDFISLFADKDFRWETVTALIRVGIGKELPSHDSDWENVLRITR